ncbi:MAG TPA: tryptophan synthase subunit alpha [Clostridiaceae bacterium]|nr:tryptophan synthase subunit alpha [Clostridiaceae bacterium]
MSRISEKFRELKRMNKKALIAFVTAGDPTINGTIQIVEELERGGADIIELGIPYSDPIAEGPVIQEANKRALMNDIKIKDIMNMVREIRNKVKVPLIYLLYYNCILQYGIEKFFEECMECGIDGLIIPDLPFEELSEIEDVSTKYEDIIDVITLVSPTSGERIKRIAKRARGFLYCVSSLGVTGEREKFSTDFNEFFSVINDSTSIPKAIGFGISTPEHVKMLKGYSDGLIIGSAIVRRIGESTTIEEAVKNVGEFVASLRKALDES